MVHEVYLWMSFIILCLIGIILVWLPFRKAQIFSIKYLFWILIAFVFAILLYMHWGSWGKLHEYQAEIQRQNKLNLLLKHLPDKMVLINKLKSHLDQSPKSAKGWYLLGKLYASEGQWRLARESLNTALLLQPGDSKIQLQYALISWQFNQQKLDKNARLLLENILTKQPEQLDALAILALDAYQQAQYQKAIAYWNKMIAILPADAPESDAARQWIAKAYRAENRHIQN